jgi:hypothetical protein
METINQTVSGTGTGGTLPPLEVVQVECPRCHRESLVLGEEGPRCKKCRYRKPGCEAARDYLEEVQGIDVDEMEVNGDDFTLSECYECGEVAVVETGPGDNAPNPHAFVCFACGETWPEGTPRCSECRRVCRLDDTIICNGCRERVMSRF